MKNFLFLGLLCIKAGTLHAGTLEVIPVDIHERLYPDRWPESKANAIHVPRGAPVTLQFALRSKKPGTATLGVRGELTGKARVHWLQSVHVEGNTQGSLKSVPAGPVPKGWFNHLVRKAPYDTLEALVEEDRMPVTADSTHGVVIEIPVSRDAKPGRYQGELLVSLANEQSAVPFSFEVHPTSLPERQPLESVHWMWAQPENLSNGEVPEWWSERHWQLLEQAGRQLRRFGDDTMYTPLINGEDALIQVRLRKDGSYHFDYSRFDRWAELFFGLGFRQLAGKHIIHIGPKVHIFDESTGTKRTLLKDPKDREAWLAFIPFFYDSLHAHLKQKGWIERYIQHQYDEPSDAALYKRLTGLARKHLPGVRTADALNNRATRFTPLTDIAVFSLLQLNKHQKTAQQRRKQGKEVWLYHCTSPYPPHPNRHIDSHLTESRLYPWLAHKLGAQGFLFWAANGYRKADEYETSLGPFPSFAAGGERYPAHPPGDNWFYYRSEDGLRPSIRIIAHREGLIDHALLSELAKRDAKKAHELVKRIAPAISKYERDPAAYHRARATILEALDHHGAETRNAAAPQTKSASIDWRDADRSCYGKVDDSGPGKHFNDNAQIVVADDGTWISTWSTGTHEGGAGMHIVYSLSHDKGRTWSKNQPIEPSTKNATSAYGYLFKSPANGRIFSIYRFHDHEKVMKEMRQLGQKPPKTGGHFRDTTGEIAFRYSDDHGKTWSERHFIPTRRTLADNPEGPMCGWFYGIGPVVIDGHVWFTGNKYKATITTGGAANSSKTSADTWETWFWKSPNMHTEKDPEKFIWENKPNGDRGIVPDEGMRYWVEASLVALKNPQNLYCVARNRYAGVLGQSFSTDGGNTWQTPPSAAQYWDGSGDLNNPKAGPMLKQLSDGTYLLTFYNDRARPDNKIPWYKLHDRSPLWVAVGWPDGKVLKFSQPEILLYNDENVKTSAEGNRSSLYHPFLFEADGEVFTVLSNKKTDVQIAKIPQSLIKGMKHQRTAQKVAQDGLVAELSAEQISAAPPREIPDSERWFEGASNGTGFSLDFWFEPGKMQPGETLLDTRDKEGRGIWVGLAEKGKLGLELKDTNNKHVKAFSAEGSIVAGQMNHAVVNVDSASHVITLIVNGVISGDNPRMNFKQYDRAFGSAKGSQKRFLGMTSDELKDPSKTSFSGEIKHLRIYKRYLCTSEAIANYRAGGVTKASSKNQPAESDQTSNKS